MFSSYSLERCDEDHVPKNIGVFENKLNGQVLSVWRCACCRVKWTKKYHG